MAYPSVTYTFTNGTTASATEVNQNFSDIISGLSAGTKDLSIAALTVAGAASFNGTVTLGNATGDDVVFTGYVASTIIPKTTNTYDFATTGLRWKDCYFSGTGYFATGIQVGTAGTPTSYTPTTLAQYMEDTLATRFTPNGAGSTASTQVTVAITRVGHMVSVTVPRANDATCAGVTAVLASSALPTWARPAHNITWSNVVYNLTVPITGQIDITTAGVINLYRDYLGSTFTTGVGAGAENMSLVYSVTS